MTEQEFNKNLEEIKGELHRIGKNTHAPIWRSFLTGALSGLGSIIGVAVALAVVAWVLNTVGVIPAFKNEVAKINHTLDQIGQNK